MGIAAFTNARAGSHPTTKGEALDGQKAASMPSLQSETHGNIRGVRKRARSACIRPTAAARAGGARRTYDPPSPLSHARRVPARRVGSLPTRTGESTRPGMAPGEAPNLAPCARTVHASILGHRSVLAGYVTAARCSNPHANRHPLNTHEHARRFIQRPACTHGHVTARPGGA